MNRFIYFVALFSVLLSCKKESSEALSVSDVVMELPPPPMEGHTKANYNMPPENSEQAQVHIPEKIIKNANIRFESTDLKATALQVKNLLKKYRAYIQNESENNDTYTVNYNITIRIPSDNFDNFINDISKGVSYFDKKEISSDDVTEEYIDVEARINTKKILEARYLKLLDKAVKVTEILEIEKQLSAIREEIESQEGRLRYMKSCINLSTINIEFYRQIAQEQGATTSYGSKIGNALQSGINSLSGFFIDLLHIWPFILIFVIAFIILRKKFRKRKE